MRYLKTQKNFETTLFESENLSKKIDDIENKASAAGLDFDDKDTQVAIATDLMDMFKDNQIAPEYKSLDMKKISDRVQAQMQAQKESKNTKNFKKIEEKFRNLDMIIESSQFTEDSLVKFQDELLEVPNFDLDNEILNFGKSGTVLSKLRPEKVTDEEILKMEKELNEILGNPEKKKSASNLIVRLGGKVLNIFKKILSVFGKLVGYVKKLVFSCANWICRNVFRMTQQKSSRYGGMFAGCVMMTVMAVILAPIVAAGAAVISGGAVISAVTAAVAGAASIGSTSKIIAYVVYLGWWYMTTSDSKEWVGLLEFLDGLEKKAGKKLKISYETRDFLTKMDREHNIKMKSTKIDTKKSKEENEAIRERYFMFHKVLEVYLKKQTIEKIAETFPIFGKILNGKEPSDADKNQFKQWSEDYIAGIDKIRAKYDDDVYKMALKSIHGYSYDTLKIQKMYDSGKSLKEISEELGISIEEVEDVIGKENKQMKKFKKDSELIPDSMFYYNTPNQKTADYLTSLIQDYGMKAIPIKGDKFKVGIYSDGKLITTITNSMYEKRRKESIEEFKKAVKEELKKKSSAQNESFRFGKIAKFRAYRY